MVNQSWINSLQREQREKTLQLRDRAELHRHVLSGCKEPRVVTGRDMVGT